LEKLHVQHHSLMLPIIYHVGYEDREEEWEYPEAVHQGKVLNVQYDFSRNHYVRSLPFHLIVMVLKGSVTYHIGGDSYLAEENRVIHIPAHTPHHISATGVPLRYIWIHYQLLVPEQSIPIMPLSPGDEISVFKGAASFKEALPELSILMKPRNYYTIKSLMKSILEEVWAEKTGWLLASRSYFQSMIMHLYREVTVEEERKGTGIADPHIAVIIEHIHSSFASKLTVEGLAAKANLSLNYFISNFKKCTGFTPGEYVARVRIQYAKKLIREGIKTVSEISDMAGFESVSYFSRVFKKIEGLTPGEFKHTEV